MNDLFMSPWCSLALHYDCGDYGNAGCECPCHDEEME